MDEEDADYTQTVLNPFRELNNYTDRSKDYRSDAVYTPPRRTLSNGWVKFHASHECGSRSVKFVESRNTSTSERYDYNLYCWDCGYRIDESDVLFINAEWFYDHGYEVFPSTFENIWIAPERVIEIGPNPDQQELLDALEISYIERNATVLGVTFGNESYKECSECGKETMLLFGNECRMCYTGPWTETLDKSIQALARTARERNGSFIHRLEQHVDPLSIHDRAFEDKILWRRQTISGEPKLVEVVQCLKDDDDGHWEYKLTDPNHVDEWFVHEEELSETYWDTNLYNETSEPIAENNELVQSFPFLL